MTLSNAPSLSHASSPRHPEIQEMVGDAFAQYVTFRQRQAQSGHEHPVVQFQMNPLNGPRVRAVIGYARRLREDPTLVHLRQHFVGTLEDALRGSHISSSLPLVDELIQVGGFSELNELFHARVQAATE